MHGARSGRSGSVLGVCTVRLVSGSLGMLMLCLPNMSPTISADKSPGAEKGVVRFTNRIDSAPAYNSTKAAWHENFNSLLR